MIHKKLDYEHIDLRLIAFFKRIFIPSARIAIFIIFFWFGFLKLIGLSPADSLALALTEQTVGLQYFDVLFILLSLMECLIGVLFLIPKMTRIVVPLLLIHMIMVCSPLLLLPSIVWQAPFVPTLEGQYIIKNAVIVAVAIGIAASTPPLVHKSK
ncbi:MAG: hypothetical protein ABIR91_01745 [Candidatus Saccharimonadales bacterium]